MRAQTLHHLIILLLVSYFLFFYRIGVRDLWNPDEPRYAQVSREMLQTGDWVVPHLNGEVYPEKPPLYFWLVALVSQPVGDVTEVTVRVPSAAAATMVVLITYLLGSRLLERREALLGAIVTATSAQFLWIGRAGVIDMLLTLSIIAALACFYFGYAHERFLLYVTGFVFLVPAALSKGPVGIAVPVLVMVVFLIVELVLRKEGAGRQFGRFLAAMLLGLIVTFAVVGPWWHAAYERSGGAYGSIQILAKQTAGRMFESYSHQRPFYYYLYQILWQFLPWTVFFPLVAHRLAKGGNLRENRELRFLATWFTTVFLFFTCISGKRSQYLLPLFPAGGLLLGWALMKLNPGTGRLSERKEFWIPLLALLLLVLGCVITLPAVAYMYAREYLWIALIAAGLGAVAFIVSACLCQRLRPSGALAGVIAATILAGALTFGYFVEVIDEYKSARPFCENILNAMGEEDGAFFYCTYRPNIHYYMGRQLPVLVEWESMQEAVEGFPRIYVIAESESNENLENLKRVFHVCRVGSGQIGKRDVLCVVISSRDPRDAGLTLSRP
ncbi:MAG: glycosyltransferase family 39 protein [Candidatus Abyssubacteria bacterium]